MIIRMPRFLLSAILFISGGMIADDIVKKEDSSSSAQALESLVDFKFDQKNVKDILNDFAQLRNFNIIYPETESITAKVTFDAGKKITLAEAWEFLTMILDQSGFVLMPFGASTYRLVTTKKYFSESVPLYINSDYTLLPDSVQKIRYVYNFNSIQLAKQQTELKSLLTTVLSSQDFDQRVIFDLASNLVIFTTSSDTIKSAMQIISVLDEVGFQEAVEIIKLEYAQASEVTKVLTNMMGGEQAKGGFVSLGSGQRARYFSEYAKVVSLDMGTGSQKLNSVIIMGKTDDVEVIKTFIQKYLDVALQKGKSFFHVVELQWLQANEFVTVLNNLVKGQTGSGSQSTSTTTSDLAFSTQVQIISEASSSGGGSGNGSAPVRGGNRLIIAAPEKDWLRIESLIKQVDIPQKQVVIEALVMDLDLQFVRNLGSQLRSRGMCSSIFPKYMQAQAGLLSQNILDTSDATAPTLLGDLSNILNPSFDDSNNPNVGSAQTASGATTVMVSQGTENGNGIWAFFQFLSTHQSAKILTRPVVVASNNKKASLGSSIVKQLASGTSAGAAPTVNYSAQDAPISISFTPIISENDSINLTIDISLNVWQDPSSEDSGTKFNRQLQSNLSMKSGDVVILGGLSKERITRTKTSVPFLDNLPLVGSLFAKRNQQTTKDQLFILIRPTVIAPKTEGGMDSITKSAMDYMSNEYTEYENVFANLKDPITRWFFDDKHQRTSGKLEKKMTGLLDVDDQKKMDDKLLSSGVVASNKEEDIKPHKHMNVGWLTAAKQTQEQQKKIKQKKELDQLSVQLKDMVNPFQRLEL